MEKPCIVSLGRYHLPGMMIAVDGGLVTVRFGHDELTQEQRSAISWRGHNREKIMVFREHQVRKTQ